MAVAVWGIQSLLQAWSSNAAATMACSRNDCRRNGPLDLGRLRIGSCIPRRP